MFGPMELTRVQQLTRENTVEEAAAKLLEFAEYPKIHRWIQFPTAVVVLLAHPDALDRRHIRPGLGGAQLHSGAAAR